MFESNKPLLIDWGIESRTRNVFIESLRKHEIEMDQSWIDSQCREAVETIEEKYADRMADIADWEPIDDRVNNHLESRKEQCRSDVENYVFSMIDKYCAAVKKDMEEKLVDNKV